MQKIGDLVEEFSVRGRDVDDYSSFNYYGVSNEYGITKSKYAAENKGEEYKVIEKGCFAYNPYRINVGSIALVEGDTKGFISPAYIVFKAKPNGVVPELLLKFLKSKEGLRQIKLHARGTVRQALRFEDLCKIEINIPDYELQKRLFQKLHNTENDVNKLASEFNKQSLLISKLRQTLLREAMQGKLVPQDPNDETASELLKKIKAEKEKLINEGKIKKQKELPEIKPEEIPYEIPESWVWCRLGEVLTEIKYGTSKRCDYDSNKNTAVLRIPNVSNGKIDIKDLKYTNLSKKELTELALEENDILMIRSNGSQNLVGKAVLVPSECKDFAYAGYLVRIKFSKIHIYPAFLWLITKSPFFRTLIEFPLRTTVGINNINSSEISNLMVPIPPLNEQQRIVSKLDGLMKFCDELERNISKSKIQTELLLQTVLREALEGKGLIKENSIEKDAFLKRKTLATYLINNSLNDTQFGETKFEKLLHLADYHAIKRNFNQNYYKKAAGPYDNSFTKMFFNQVEKSKWFKKKRIGNLNRILPAENHTKSLNTYNLFSKKELQRVDRVINYFQKYNYEQPEIVSTLYAVWNDRIIMKKEISDDLLIEDFYNWDKQKRKYERDRVRKALNWMKNENFNPDGWGKLIKEKKN